MPDKKHQTHDRSYQIRVDGNPAYYPDSMDSSTLKKFVEICEENEGCYVDIVRVDTNILFSQFEYSQMKRHFET